MIARFVPPQQLVGEQAVLHREHDGLQGAEASFAAPVVAWTIHPDSAADPVGRLTLAATPEPGAAAVAVEVSEAHRGHGYASAAVRAAASWYLTQAGDRLLWSGRRGDFDTWRVAWACGFRRVGYLAPTAADPHGSWLACLSAADSLEAATPWVEPPVIPLTTPDAIIRPWSPLDVDRVVAAGAATAPDDIFDASRFPEWLLARREQMATGTAASWCIAAASSDLPLGEVILFVDHGRLDDDTAELGYSVAPAARGSGLAQAAAAAAIEYARTSVGAGGLGLRRLTAQTSAANGASNATLAALGFTRWGREPNADAIPTGTSVDEFHWSLLL